LPGLPGPLSPGGGDGYLITGTPATAGTYNFTLQVTNQAGGSGTTQLFITVGTGTADNLVGTQATYQVSRRVGGLNVEAWDVNAGATYTVYATSTGAKIGTMTALSDGLLDGGGRGIPNPQNVTIKDSLGSSVSLPVILRPPYCGTQRCAAGHDGLSSPAGLRAVNISTAPVVMVTGLNPSVRSQVSRIAGSSGL